MRSPRGALILLVIVAVVGGAVWWWRSRPGSPALSTVIQPAGSGSQAAAGAAPRGRPAPASVEVAVTDDRGPVGGAAVRLAPRGGEVIVVRAGADGVARADPLPPGEWRISASAAGHEPAALPPQQLAAGAAARLALRLPVGGRPLTGVVTDVSGGPVAGARLDAARLLLGRPDRAVATALTGADGRYELAVPEGALVVAARSPDYAAQLRNVEVGPAGARADFALVPGGAIEGVVLDERTRQPVPGATIAARRERSSAIALAEAGGHRAVAGPDGRFRVAGLRPGVYELDADAEGRHARSPSLVGLGVAEQVTTLSGTVRGPRGPAALFTVELDGPTRAQRSFTDGKFELGRVDPGAYTLRVRSSEGNAEAKVEVAAGTPATVDLTLAANAIVTGTIVDAAGKPLAGVPVTVVEQKDNSVSVSMSGPPPTSGPDGRFRLEHKAGPSALVILVPPRPTVKRGLLLESGKTLDLGEVRVDAPPPPAPPAPAPPAP